MYIDFMVEKKVHEQSDRIKNECATEPEVIISNPKTKRQQQQNMRETMEIKTLRILRGKRYY